MTIIITRMKRRRKRLRRRIQIGEGIIRIIMIRRRRNMTGGEQNERWKEKQNNTVKKR